MAVAAMKHMASNFAKLDKFKGMDFRRWQKKMHFLLSSMSMVYLLTTLIPDDGDDATVEQLRKWAKWDNDDYKRTMDSLEAKYMAEDASSKKFLVSNFTNYKMTDSRPVMEQYNELLRIHDFKHTLKHKKEELTLVELGSHMRIKESLKVQDSDKPKGNNVAGPQLNIVNDNIASAFMSTSKLNDSILWHARLGHVHFKRMQDMSKDGLIPAFDMDTEKCKTCMLNKITKKPFQNVKCKTKVLELIHNDLCDLHATPSLGNKKYFVTFIDDASRFCYVYLLHSKDEALDKFKVFKIEVELQQGSQIKRFRTDKGGEYMDTLYFQSVGIIHEMTAPILHKNGISERKNRVLKEMVNSMLSYSGLSQGAVVRLPDPKLKTLGERSIECIFVGYAEHSKAFRFYVIEPRFSSVPRLSLRIPNGTEDIGGSAVPEEVVQQPEPELKKAKGIGLQRILDLNFNYT
ncbi:zinc finger, CCHC-type containing protein [Tanacetum coccineum]